MQFSPEIKYDIDELERMISKGEGVQLDFKQAITSQRKIARTLAAFANNRGGKLLIGVKDNGTLIGCDIEEEMYMIHEAAEHFCEPPVDVDFTVYETDDLRSIVVATVNNSLRKPHFAQDDHGEWQLYMRSIDKTLIASKKTQRMLELEDGEEDSTVLDTKERFVLEYLKIKQTITAKILAQQLNISIQRANVMLVKLAKLGLILYDKDERGEHYLLR